jgi:hypothetical protein
MAVAHVILSLEKMPEVIQAMRMEMVKILRETADAETLPTTAKRLREVALIFETGSREP